MCTQLHDAVILQKQPEGCCKRASIQDGRYPKWGAAGKQTALLLPYMHAQTELRHVFESYIRDLHHASNPTCMQRDKHHETSPAWKLRGSCMKPQVLHACRAYAHTMHQLPNLHADMEGLCCAAPVFCSMHLYMCFIML